jgi:hypothetical protein
MLIESLLSNEVSACLVCPAPPAPVLGDPEFTGRKAALKVTLPALSVDGDPLKLKTVELFYSKESMDGNEPQALRDAKVPCVTVGIPPGVTEVDVEVDNLEYASYFFAATVTV